MIADNPKSSFWQSVYKSALEAAKGSNDCLEMISDNLSRDYSVYELMEIATISGVDGIIVSADESEEMTELIDRAAANGIQVVTLYNDNSASARLSYVGVSNYNRGKQYGELILKIAQEKKFTDDKIEVVIFADVNSADAAQNLMFTAVQETVDSENPEKRSIHPPIELTIYGVDTTSELSVEESIKTFLLKDRESLPEIVVCLNEMDTIAAYQTVVDYNEVGLVNILGYYDSEVILNGIDRNVIYATISADTEQMGRYSVNALDEYFRYGYTSQYFTSDISVITKDNVAQYMEDTDEN
jgi:ribose transport system substrate-binding protein